MNEMQQPRGVFLGFMTTVPGILTATAAVVTAAGGVYLGIHQDRSVSASAPLVPTMTSQVSSSALPSPVNSVDPNSIRSAATYNLASNDPVLALVDQCDAGDAGACASILDTLSQECADGTATSCDVLYELSPAGSMYEAYGATCGGRWTTEDYADTCGEQ